MDSLDRDIMATMLLQGILASDGEMAFKEPEILVRRAMAFTDELFKALAAREVGK